MPWSCSTRCTSPNWTSSNWLAAAFEKVSCSLAITGGVHTPTDLIKSMMAGADIAQMTSALLIHGPDYAIKMLTGVREWMAEFEYESIRQMRGSMSLARTPDPEAYERANYLKSLNTWHPGSALR